MKITKLERDAPFLELETPRDAMADSRLETVNTIIGAIRRAGVYPERPVFTGCEGADIERNRSFGDRLTTWAFTERQVIGEATLYDRLGVTAEEDGPFYYADASDEQPALVVYDAGLLVCKAELDELAMDEEFIVKPGCTMDQAAAAVLYIRD